MGEYIKHPVTGEEIKIATMDDCFFSREELLEFKRRGFKGFYAGKFDVMAGRKDTLDNVLNHPRTLFQPPRGLTFKPKIHTVVVKNNGIEHSKVILHKKGNRGSVYVYAGLPCDQKDHSHTYAVIVGERYDEQGRARTIFACDCCGKLFSLTEDEINRLKEKHPYWAEHLKPHP